MTRLAKAINTPWRCPVIEPIRLIVRSVAAENVRQWSPPFSGVAVFEQEHGDATPLLRRVGGLVSPGSQRRSEPLEERPVAHRLDGQPCGAVRGAEDPE